MSTSARVKSYRRPFAAGFLSACLALSFCLSFTAPAQTREHQDRGTNAERRNDIGPARAADIARERNGGKVLKVEQDGDAWRVKLLLPSGRVKSVWVDAAE